jgi:large subunit ribosomal protein L25
MEAIYLDAEIREEKEIGKSKILRRANFVPCVVYGEKKKTISLKIERGRLIKFMHAHHGGENMVITLKVSGADKKKADEKAVIIKEIQVHPVNDEILHVDFNEISLTKRIEVKVPIAGSGECFGVKQEGGTLEQILWEIEVECLPTQIPEKLTVDISNLKIGDTIHVKDLVIPEGVNIKHDAEAIVFSVAQPFKEEVAGEEAIEGAPGAIEPEVIKKEKKVAEEGEAQEGKPETKEKAKS